MIVVLTDEAEADLEEIGNYIATDSPLRAITFVQDLVERCHLLAEMPRAFPLIAPYEHSGVRRRPYGQYLIFYRIGGEQIDVLHILNSAQDYEAIVFANTA